MRIRWTEEAVRFLREQEETSPGLGRRILLEAEDRLRRFAGVHVVVPILDEDGTVRHVFRMFLSRKLPYKVYYMMTEPGVVVVLAVRHARQRPIELA